MYFALDLGFLQSKWGSFKTLETPQSVPLYYETECWQPKYCLPTFINWKWIQYSHMAAAGWFVLRNSNIWLILLMALIPRLSMSKTWYFTYDIFLGLYHNIEISNSTLKATSHKCVWVTLFISLSLSAQHVEVIKKDFGPMRCDELMTLHTNIIWSQSATDLHYMGFHTNPSPDG